MVLYPGYYYFLSHDLLARLIYFFENTICSDYEIRTIL